MLSIGMNSVFKNHTVSPARIASLRLEINSKLKNSWILGGVRKTTGVSYVKKLSTN